MPKRVKRKAVVAAIIEIVCLVALGFILNTMQTNLSVSNQQSNTAEKLAQVKELLTNASTTEKTITDNFDATYISRVESVAYMYQRQVTDQRSDAQMKDFCDLLHVTNVLLLNRDGEVLARAQGSPSDFRYNRFNQLRTVFDSEEASEPFQVTVGTQTFRYYGARIDDNTMAVLEVDPAELNARLSENSTYESLLENVTVGLNGYPFLISGKTNTFLYHPNVDMVGQDALDLGIPVEELKDNNFTWLTVDGQELYCGIAEVDSNFVVCAVTAEELASSRSITNGVILFICFAVMSLIILYVLLIAKEEKDNPKRYIRFKNCVYNKYIGRKAQTISIISLICILLITFYMQTLFALSQQAMSNNERIESVEDTIAHYQTQLVSLKEQYDNEILITGQIAAHILNTAPELQQKEPMIELNDILGTEMINVFNGSGDMVISSSSYNKFSLSDDPEDQSYDFQKLLLGVDYVVQEAQPDEISGELHQYVGVSMLDDAGNADGFTQISIAPSNLTTTLTNMELGNVLSSIKVGRGGFIFAVDKEDSTFSYYPQNKMVGRKATAYGMEKNQFTDGYSNYITLNGVRYYGSSVEADNNYIYIVVPESSMTANRIPVTVVTGAISLFGLLLLYLILTFSKKTLAEEIADEAEAKKALGLDAPVEDSTVVENETKKVDSAANRWSNFSMKWSEQSPEQQLSTLLRGLFALMAVLICIAIVFEDQLFDSNSIFRYVLDGKWERGVNIFALTASIMILCVVSTLTLVVRKLLQMAARTFSAQGETICRLLRSFIKYGSCIAILYYCLALFGIDTKTLVASAGILTLVVGLGANSLVSDILAGLFIIFEGEFRVGDIVTVGTWRGTVVEIGIRTTKIEDGTQNIKIISNRDVTGVINMTRRYSYSWVDVGIEYGESLERVENILEEEFPNIKRRLPKIIDGPFYKGVVSLGDNSVNIRIMVSCAESNRIQMERDLNREMKLIFDKHDINIPFPQIVLNQPTEYKKATEWEKWKADKFTETQKTLSKNMDEDEEEMH